MPLYQFVCEGCMNAYEIFMSLADNDLYDELVDAGKKRGREKTKCPECKTYLRKLICPVQFRIEA